jgi:predicted unusual protein kinase regulating ubiquinone biosynthesis (AarF/ABC1/UbiB family)
VASNKSPAKSRTKRFFKLAGMTASVATRYAGEKIKDAVQDEETRKQSKSRAYGKMAEDITETLGELKGAVMKVGQIVSQTQDFLPAEFSEALKKLQKEAPPVDFNVIKEQVESELGGSLSVLFKSFDEKPHAAASIGQVHRAVTHEGKDVIVKVQYPGVARSVNSDLKQLKLTLKLGGLLKMPKESVDRLFNELQERLNEELDYELEAKNLKMFHDFHRDDHKIVIPDVIDALSTASVITLEFVDGDSIDALDDLDYTDQERETLANKMFDMLSSQLFVFQCIHGDPHPGNFAFRKDGTVVVYDFGCVKKLKPEVVHAYRDAVVYSIEEAYTFVDDALIRLGARVANKPSPGADYYKIWRDIFFQPFMGGRFDYGVAQLHIESAKHTGLFFKHLALFQPPVESLYIDRMVSGHYWILKSMKASANFRSALDEHLFSSRYTSSQQ